MEYTALTQLIDVITLAIVFLALAVSAYLYARVRVLAVNFWWFVLAAFMLFLHFAIHLLSEFGLESEFVEVVLDAAAMLAAVALALGMLAAYRVFVKERRVVL